MERLNLLLERERFDAIRFEGRPVEFFPSNISLPPPADPPTKAKTQTQTQQQPDIPTLTKGNSTVGLVLRPLLDGPKKGLLCWQYPLALVDEAERMLVEGVPRPEVARRTDLSYNAVVRIDRQMKSRAAAEQPPAAEPAPTIAADPPEAPAPAVEAIRLSTAEPQRLGVLQWADRMRRYEFSTAPEHCQPGKGRSHGKGMTHHQLTQFIRSDRGPSSGMNINTTPRAPVQSIAQLFA
ncbi:hypothetical protein [Paraburkholderia sp. GAS348]|uniref:hypothetical protein n=1 Tax=Paraburkholderia sp. GAS348 TaxID=3035132 RepID=UPI003D20C0F1